MAESHPSRNTLELFLHDQLPEKDQQDVVGHLLEDCPTCQRVTGETWTQLLDGLKAATLDVPETPIQHEAGRALTDYRNALNRALDHAVEEARTLEHHRAVAEQLYEELREHPHKRRLTLVRNSRRFQTPELCQLLIDKGFDQRFAQVQLGVELTELAVAVGQQMSETTYGPRATWDLLGRAWAYHGNALRVASELRLSEEALGEATRCFAAGQKDELDKALWCRFKALLLRARREFEEASTLQDRAIELYLRVGETLRAAFVLADQALGLLYEGESELAIPKFDHALELFIEHDEMRGIASVRHNLALCLTEVGRHEEALQQVAAVRPGFQQLGDYLSLIRLRWLEGRVLHALGREWQAEEALTEAREAFIEEAIGYDAALVCLDLAMVFASQGRLFEMRELAEKMLPIFHSRDVHREALAALIIFHEAVQAETVTLALIEKISHYLRRARHDPKLRFERG